METSNLGIAKILPARAAKILSDAAAQEKEVRKDAVKAAMIRVMVEYPRYFKDGALSKFDRLRYVKVD